MLAILQVPATQKDANLKLMHPFAYVNLLNVNYCSPSQLPSLSLEVLRKYADVSSEAVILSGCGPANPRRSLRRDALAKLATLAASSPQSAGKQVDIARLCKRCPGTRSRVNGSTNGRVSRTSMGTAAVARVPMVGYTRIELLQLRLIGQTTESTRNRSSIGIMQSSSSCHQYRNRRAIASTAYVLPS